MNSDAKTLRYESDRNWSRDQKKELFGVLLVGSGAPPDEGLKHLKLKVLSQEEAKEALEVLEKEWNLKAEPTTPRTVP